MGNPVSFRAATGSAFQRAIDRHHAAGLSVARTVHRWAEEAEQRGDTEPSGDPRALREFDLKRYATIHRERYGSSETDAIFAVRGGWRP